MLRIGQGRLTTGSERWNATEAIGDSGRQRRRRMRTGRRRLTGMAKFVDRDAVHAAIDILIQEEGERRAAAAAINKTRDKRAASHAIVVLRRMKGRLDQLPTVNDLTGDDAQC